MSKCRKLYEYAFLIKEIRTQLASGKKLKAAVDSAVSLCIQEGILEQFLRKHRAEVTGVILTEYNQERHIKNEKQISYEQGQKDGSVRTAIQIYQKMGKTKTEIRQILTEEFRLMKEEAERYLETDLKERDTGND